ncbi:hypothetical protein AC578_3111 [Pseudocercospora eumusae]|uniref:Zn(2)-C6 fungal-type domain-containing protein n=1 Tax=Pseudocercospora eumusae TaxID=321146 RepID=A0A139H662_9PEZI|nr:hypothetical protein AC578_3111 [Pseudocercospora eumusae]
MPVTQRLNNASQAAVTKPPTPVIITAEHSELNASAVGKAPRVGHKKSRNGCAQCKRRHVKCNEEAPCSNCLRHGVACSLAGGPFVPREDAKARRNSTTSRSPNAVPVATSMDATRSSSTASAAHSPASPNPFAILTGKIDRPMNQDSIWQLDLQLMHHYISHAKYVMTEDQDVEYIMQIWRDEIPKVAFSHDYVMHGLLGFSALHKATLEPQNAGYLQAAAVDHLDKALVLYRQDRGVPATAENANAKFAFTWLVALFAYAVPPSIPPIDAIVELFMLVKGIDAIVSDTWYWVAQGALAPMLNRGFQEAVTTSISGYNPLPDGMDFGLGHLDFMLGVEAMIYEERRSCAIVLAELKQIYQTVLQTQGGCSIANILCFPKQDSTSFAGLIKRKVPQAMIILAYYCVLLNVLDDRWWMQGWAARVLTDVLGDLDEVWKHWVEWPVEHVIMKQHKAGGLNSVPTTSTDESARIATLLI